MKINILIVIALLTGFVIADSIGGGGGGGSISPGASAYNSGTQTIAGNGTAALTFNTNQWDTCSSCTIHSTSTNPTRFTAPSTAYYLVVAGFVSATSGCVGEPFFAVNGVQSVPTAGAVVAGSTTGCGSTISQIFHLNSGDFVEVDVFSSTGLTTAANDSMMSMTKLSSTL